MAALTRRSVLLGTAAGGLAACSSAEPTPSPGESAQQESAQRRRPTPEPALTPRRLSIPSLEVSTSLVMLGLNKDRTVEVPRDPARAGWFRLGTVPGRRGSAVVLGHVDSIDGPAVFAGLAGLRSRDRVQVLLSDDSLVTFEVTDVETFANAAFPAERVYAGTTSTRDLNLVTCGGDYDRDRGGYQSNVVVFTTRTRA